MEGFTMFKDEYAAIPYGNQYLWFVITTKIKT